MTSREKPDWTRKDMADTISVRLEGRTYYHPDYLREVDVGAFGRFLNKRFGISPFREITSAGDDDAYYMPPDHTAALASIEPPELWHPDEVLNPGPAAQDAQKTAELTREVWDQIQKDQYEL